MTEEKVAKCDKCGLDMSDVPEAWGWPCPVCGSTKDGVIREVKADG